MSELDPYADDELAALYDLDLADYDADLAMYEQFARRGDSPSLELGAGSGRVALHLARVGLPVVALDASAAMLARLRASLDADGSLRVRVIEGDMRAFDLGERFDLIYCALNTFEHLLSTEDQLAALRGVGRHLADGGVFVFQVRRLMAVDWTAPQSPLQLQWHRRDPASGEMIAKLSSMIVSPSRQLIAETQFFDRAGGDGIVRRRALEVTLRVSGRFEIELLLREAGLRLAAIYGDAELSPFDDDSDTMILVAEREGA